ncbi:unnamed protein product [Nippostrongylus brasiliensis]|uniref:Neur_chan_LBD domain-containing protein n=1 Tax=Nippostrongylus brasiliensis TaxID=27835 RepID=A0A0N4YMV0_NIPBR|nr:unnamed protein product [Nippostrongylus brasiliensis]
MDQQEILVSSLFANYRKQVPPLYTKLCPSDNAPEPIFVNITLNYVKLLSVVKHTGEISFYVTYVFTVVCPMNIQKFPFDRQSCEVNFVSFNFFDNELRLVCGLIESFNISYASNGEWSVYDITTDNSTLYSSGYGRQYDLVTVTLNIERSSTFYVVLIVIPSFILTFLCVLGLFWSKFDHTDYLEKLGLGFAAILAMCMVLEIAEESVPKTRQLPSLSVYIMVNLLLITISISIVVMGSKSSDISCLFQSSGTSKNPKK